MAGGDGILSGPIDLDGPRRPQTVYPSVEAVPGLVVTQRGTPFTGRVIEARGDRMTIRDERTGREHICRLTPGGFEVDGRPVTLVPPGREAGRPARRRAHRVGLAGRVPAPRPGWPAPAASSSRASHDAELVERVWGDDLRVEGVVVEPLDGADNLPEVVRSFGPRPGRRLGILLDHLVLGSKEQRLAATLDHPDVLVTGHPFVDVWQAIKPEVAGIERWPEVPPGQPWKEGVLAALGIDGHPGPVLEAPPRSGDQLDRPRTRAHRRGRAPHRLRDRARARLTGRGRCHRARTSGGQPDRQHTGVDGGPRRR